MFVGAPASLLLTKYGVIEYNNVGNVIETDKEYDESAAIGQLLGNIENGKIKIKDTYINNLPFFLKITNSYKPMKSEFDGYLIDWLQNKGNENAVFEYSNVMPRRTPQQTTVRCHSASTTLKENGFTVEFAIPLSFGEKAGDEIGNR